MQWTTQWPKELWTNCISSRLTCKYMRRSFGQKLTVAKSSLKVPSQKDGLSKSWCCRLNKASKVTGLKVCWNFYNNFHNMPLALLMYRNARSSGSRTIDETKMNKRAQPLCLQYRRGQVHSKLWKSSKRPYQSKAHTGAVDDNFRVTVDNI